MNAYLNRLASAQPTPGGGSAATLVGAFGAALVAMVARLTLGSPKHAAVHAEATLLIEAADQLRSQFVGARPEDEAAFAAVVAVQALPRSTDEEKATRRGRLQAALVAAAEAPLRAAGLARLLFDISARGADLRNGHLMSDIECALAFARATLDATAANVRINHRYIDDIQLTSTQTERLASILAAASAAERRAKAIIAGLE